MDETPELSETHHPVAELAATPAGRPLDQVLDGLSLLVFGWAAVLWQLGSNAVRDGAAALAGLPELPGFSDLPGVTESGGGPVWSRSGSGSSSRVRSGIRS